MAAGTAPDELLVSHLRQAMAPMGNGASLIRTQSPGYVLCVDPERIDAHRFERLAGQGRDALAASGPQRAAELLGEALALWRGPALADFAYEGFASVEATRLEELRLATVEAEADAHLALGRHASWSVGSKPSSTTTPCASDCGNS